MTTHIGGAIGLLAVANPSVTTTHIPFTVIFAFPLAILFTAFWIWMLVESAKRKQFGWLIAIALTNVFGAFAYYLFGRSFRSPSLQP